MKKNVFKTCMLLVLFLNIACSSDNEEQVPATLPNIATNTISNLSENSATSGGVIVSDGGSNIITKGIVWNTQPNPTINLNTKTIDGSGNSTFTSTLINLIKGTTYYVRSYATNSLGTVYGNEIIFLTPDISSNAVYIHKFDNSGQDLSGNNFNATLNASISYTSNRNNNPLKSLNFSSPNSGRVSFPNSIGAFEQQMTNNSFTFCFWFNHSYDNVPSNNNIFFKGGSWAEGGIKLNSNKNIIFHQINKPTITTNTVFNKDQWYFVSIVYDGGSDTLKIFINGQQDISQTYIGFNFSTVINTPAAGTGVFLGDNFHGKIDNFMLLARALSSYDLDYIKNNID
jgi:hypothetical protein